MTPQSSMGTRQSHTVEGLPGAEGLHFLCADLIQPRRSPKVDTLTLIASRGEERFSAVIFLASGFSLRASVSQLFPAAEPSSKVERGPSNPACRRTPLSVPLLQNKELQGKVSFRGVFFSIKNG